jgi:hypothetical protein
VVWCGTIPAPEAVQREMLEQKRLLKLELEDEQKNKFNAEQILKEELDKKLEKDNQKTDRNFGDCSSNFVSFNQAETKLISGGMDKGEILESKNVILEVASECCGLKSVKNLHNLKLKLALARSKFAISRSWNVYGAVCNYTLVVYGSVASIHPRRNFHTEKGLLFLDRYDVVANEMQLSELKCFKAIDFVLVLKIWYNIMFTFFPREGIGTDF